MKQLYNSDTILIQMQMIELQVVLAKSSSTHITNNAEAIETIKMNIIMFLESDCPESCYCYPYLGYDVVTCRHTYTAVMRGRQRL